MMVRSCSTSAGEETKMRTLESFIRGSGKQRRKRPQRRRRPTIPARGPRRNRFDHPERGVPGRTPRGNAIERSESATAARPYPPCREFFVTRTNGVESTRHNAGRRHRDVSARDRRRRPHRANHSAVAAANLGAPGLGPLPGLGRRGIPGLPGTLHRRPARGRNAPPVGAPGHGYLERHASAGLRIPPPTPRYTGPELALPLRLRPES